MNKSHAHEKDRILPNSSSDDDFASSGPFELFTLLVLTCVFAASYVSVPRTLSSIYGETATQLYRPTIAMLVVGFAIASKPKSRKSTRSVFLIAVTALVWASCLKYGGVVLTHDTAVIESLFEGYNNMVAQISKQVRIPPSITSISAIWAPIISSTISETCFRGTLGVTIISILRERSRRTKLPTVFLMSALLAIGLALSSIFDRYGLNTLDYMFFSIVALVFLSVLNIRSWQGLLVCIFSSLTTLWLLHSTTTLSCSALPGLLQCPKDIGGFTIKAHSNSITGHVSVVENEKYRLMKVDHSLLGGEWLGQGSGQSIFTTFYMQSLAIYAFTPPRKDLKVLQIGLGIGTATKTLLNSAKFGPGSGNLHIDVVELDPKVVEYAHDFFDLPRPTADSRLTTHPMDALDFVKVAQNDTYDLISHDIFTGGSLTFSLFTVELFEQLKSKLTRGGILTVNYVYSPSLAQENFESVLNTLRSIFSDVIVYIESGTLTTINNLVFFCSDVELTLDIPDSGREPTTNFGQTARKMQSWQFTGISDIPFNTSQILHDEWVDFGASRSRILQSDRNMALEHWRFMRSLFPPPENLIWTSY